MNDTAIKWTEKSWNPVTGCSQLSAGCRFCYAKRIAESPKKAGQFPNGFKLTLRPERLQEPADIVHPAMIFVNSMSDLFWDEIPDAFVHKVIDAIEATPRHTYQILTKRPDRMRLFSEKRPLPESVWAGVTIESQTVAHRMDELLQVKGARFKFISAEPLLTPLDLDWKAVDWVIAGGESGAHLLDPVARQKRGLVDFVPAKRAWVPRTDDRADWVRAIRDGCVTAGTAFFFKQWGGYFSDSGGNILDGRIWEEFPG